MRRTRWGSSARPAARLLRPVVPSVLSLGLLIATPGLAEADPTADNLAALIADVAKSNQRLQNLSAEIQTEQESVNKALVDVAWATGVYTEANHFVLNKDVSGFETNPADMIELGQTTVR